MFQRLFIRKKSDFRVPPYDIELLKDQLSISHLTEIENINIYDLHHAPQSQIALAIEKIFCDPITDDLITQLPDSDYCLIIEALPGQFDQRADSAEQCLKLLSADFEKTIVRSATAYLFKGQFSELEKQKLRQYLINPIESREKDLQDQQLPVIADIEAISYIQGFTTFSQQQLYDWYQSQQLAMTFDDLKLIQNHFQTEQRDPSETEIRVLDTYWSDHCRHSTFSTALKDIRFPDSAFGQLMRADYDDFLSKQAFVYKDKAKSKPITLMDLATIDAKFQRKQGHLNAVEFSAEINACSVFIDVNYSEKPSEKWLLQFKNETHNHPTEIEPYGGASTCIGGAIRDPLSGRAYVYQAMRLSGSADPRENIKDTLPGKLPQFVIGQRSAAGASAYGNQIGLATGQIVEIYHQGYKAKHMEVGAVVAATPADHVRREVPSCGDLVLLLGGKTGRDGCGGATGSSKKQHHDSLNQSAAEVQKGNPPEERKLQRLFRNKHFTQLIKRCNDFGAGGVAVAIGELADGLDINLDAIPAKYQGLSGTELAISESQERMAIVIERKDLAIAQQLATAENLTATVVAEVTNDNYLSMHFQSQRIVHLNRDFLNSNGAKLVQSQVELADYQTTAAPKINANWIEHFTPQLQSLAYCDQQGLGDRFDFNVGASCVLLPYGGSTMRSPSEASVYLIPTETTPNTASILAYGFNPNISSGHAYLGGLYAVIEATARYIAVGGQLKNLYFSLQEYFPRLGDSPTRWGLPLAALLGAHHGLSALGRAAIGGKDSMSGSFNDLDVPPTLIAFAVGPVEKQAVISSEFKDSDHHIYLLHCPKDDFNRPDLSVFKSNIAYIEHLNAQKQIQSLRSLRQGGLIQGLYESSLGNHIGIDIQYEDLFNDQYGSFLISSAHQLEDHPHLVYLGQTLKNESFTINAQSIALTDLYQKAQGLKEIYPLNPVKNNETSLATIPAHSKKATNRMHKVAKPKICMPVFPGTNSELDMQRAFKQEQAPVNEIVINNQNQSLLQQSLQQLAKHINNSQIIALSGGFSAGDEPDGSGKFIANILNQPMIRDAIHDFLRREGLILGICNGFQALIKSGLLSYGCIQTPKPSDPTLTHNIGKRHIARIVQTKIINNHSPWLADFSLHDIHDIPISHGEGRFYTNAENFEALINNGQIATQYVNPITGDVTMNINDNPNGSYYAIEGMTSPCGRIFGKMGHSERYQQDIYRNYPDFRYQNIFSNGVKAFS